MSFFAGVGLKEVSERARVLVQSGYFISEEEALDAAASELLEELEGDLQDLPDFGDFMSNRGIKL